MAKTNNVSDFCRDIANAIREKKGTTGDINAQDFADEIASIETGGVDVLENQGLLVTANGSYAPPEGVRYNPIVVSISGAITSSDVGSIIRMMDLSTSWGKPLTIVDENDYSAANIEAMTDLLINLTRYENE